MSQPLADDLLAGARAAAAFTGLSRRVIYHLVESGALPVRRIGRRLYFRRSELERAFRAAVVEHDLRSGPFDVTDLIQSGTE